MRRCGVWSGLALKKERKREILPQRLEIGREKCYSESAAKEK